MRFLFTYFGTYMNCNNPLPDVKAEQQNNFLAKHEGIIRVTALYKKSISISALLF